MKFVAEKQPFLAIYLWMCPVRLFLPNAAMNVPNFRCRNFVWGLLPGKPTVYDRKILDWPKFGPFRSLLVKNLARNVVFRRFLPNAAMNVLNVRYRNFFGVFYLENLLFMTEKFWIAQNLALLGPNLAPFGPNLAQNVVFRLFLANAAMNVPNFCYINFFGVFYLENLLFTPEKIWIGQNLALLGPNLVPFGQNLSRNVVFHLFLPNVAMNVTFFCYRNIIWDLLLGQLHVYARKILDWPIYVPLGPNLAPFGPNFTRNVVFRIFLPNAATNVRNFCYINFI